jgi:DNA processing protein
VFAVPGNVGTPTSTGTNRLIKAGATLVETAADLVDQLVGQLGNAGQRVAVIPSVVIDLSADERRVFDLLSWDPAHVDELTVRSSVAPDRLAELLLGLELKGVAKRVPGHRYVRQVTVP